MVHINILSRLLSVNVRYTVPASGDLAIIIITTTKAGK